MPEKEKSEWHASRPGSETLKMDALSYLRLIARPWVLKLEMKWCLSLEGDELHITTQQRRIQRAQQRARNYLKHGKSLVEELLAERRQEAKNE